MIKIFYDERQNVDNLDSYSPSAGKPKRFAQLAMRNSFASAHAVTPVQIEDLELVHSKDYVKGVFNGSILNGFENDDPRIPGSCLWTIGSLLSAARYAIANPVAPVCSPTSGFHHAGYNQGGGFCTFNGLMVTAAALLRERPGIKIGILDCDHHFGDGTVDILNKLDLHEHIIHRSQGAKFLDDPSPKEFQRWLEIQVGQINEFAPDIVLYQAGADPHMNDPLGGFLDDKQLSLRDQTVFDGINSAIVWNLAGGYQANPGGTIETDPVLRVHLNTLRAARGSIQHRQHLLETT